MIPGNVRLRGSDKTVGELNDEVFRDNSRAEDALRAMAEVNAFGYMARIAGKIERVVPLFLELAREKRPHQSREDKVAAMEAIGEIGVYYPKRARALFNAFEKRIANYAHDEKSSAMVHGSMYGMAKIAASQPDLAIRAIDFLYEKINPEDPAQKKNCLDDRAAMWAIATVGKSSREAGEYALARLDTIGARAIDFIYEIGERNRNLAEPAIALLGRYDLAYSYNKAGEIRNLTGVLQRLESWLNASEAFTQAADPNGSKRVSALLKDIFDPRKIMDRTSREESVTHLSGILDRAAQRYPDINVEPMRSALTHARALAVECGDLQKLTA